MNWRLLGMALGVAALGAATILLSKRDGEDKEALAAVEEWLGLIDRGEYGRGWNEAAAFMRGQVESQDFQRQLAGARVPLGKVLSRKLITKASKASLPGAPDGQYIVFQFDTSFEKKKNAVETVTPMVDPDGMWRVSGYYIR